MGGIDRDGLVAEVLAGQGSIRLAFLLEKFVPAAQLRGFARKHGITVKGFRVDRVPVAKLASLIAKQEQPEVDEAIALLVEAVTRELAKAPRGDAEAAAEPTVSPEVSRLRRELELVQRELERATRQVERARAPVDELRETLERERVAVATARSRINYLERELDAVRSTGRGDDQVGDDGRVRELQRELDGLAESEERLRRQIALELTARRDAEERADELEAELDRVAPKRRGRRRPRPTVTDESTRMRIPYFSESFVKSLETMDRRMVEAAYRAIFVLCTEGPGYPSLEHKKLEGQQELHSVRAGIKVRVYFRYRAKGDIDVLEISDREDQDTTLRRLKER